MSVFRNRSALILALSSAVLLAACGKQAPPPAAPPPAAAPAPAQTPPPAPAPAPAAMPAPTVSVAEVVLGNAVVDNKIATPVKTFAPKDSIHALVSTNSTAPATIVARWTYQGGQLVKETTQTLTTANGVTVSHFEISKPDGWPVGDYSLDILLDGKSISTTTFSVK